MQLNLARKYRSKNFDEVVGQELVVRLLKNSLYRNMLFPVYLLAGMRGCGKTTVGRLFASALNCQRLEEFKNQPQSVILPCSVCPSCVSMAKGQHPDFIEIDAASHTGVDNIRQIIDTATFVPVLGTKKIYLIDETHMLSKAAFNALLKILEEPPVSVVFILATTDVHKVIETVKSRCFQLFFSPVNLNDLVLHLQNLCNLEQIDAEKDALEVIAQESEGSVRDAINILERVKLTHLKITKSAVFEALGFLSDDKLITILETIIDKSHEDIINLCSYYKLEKYNIQFLWKRLVELLRSLLYAKQSLGVPFFAFYQDRIKLICEKITHEKIMEMIELCYHYEAQFMKTSLVYPFFEMMLIKLNLVKKKVKSATYFDKLSMSGGENRPSAVQPAVPDETRRLVRRSLGEGGSFSEVGPTKSPWNQVIDEVEKKGEELLNSIFKQAKFNSFDSNTAVVEISFPENLIFFKELLDSSKSTWQPILNMVFGAQVTCKINFSESIKETKVVAKEVPKAAAPVAPKSYSQPSYSGSREPAFKIPNEQEWPKSAALSKLFPGTLNQLK